MKLLHLHRLGIFLHTIKSRVFALPFSPSPPFPFFFIQQWKCKAPQVGFIPRCPEQSCPNECSPWGGEGALAPLLSIPWHREPPPLHGHA